MGLFKSKEEKKGLTKGESIQTSKEELYGAVGIPSENDITQSLVMLNDGVNICATACAACWDTKLPDQYADRAAYIGRRTKTGHTSVVEHSNVVFYMYIPNDYTDELVELLDSCNFLHTVVRHGVKRNGWHMIIGGSWRGFSDLYLTIPSIAENRIAQAITNGVYQYIPSHGMQDIIDKNLLDASQFEDPEYSTLADDFCLVKNKRLDEDINIINCDDIYTLIKKIMAFCSEPEVFTVHDLMRFCTVTIEFNHMSRIITQQLTRHRNAITQESQRYVDYSGAPFNSPAKFKDKYDPKKLYEFSFGGTRFKMNLQNLGDAINKIYPQLRDKLKLGDNALLPEDARAFLANNTQCGKIYITFTYYNLIKFLELREDSHAQAEIRSYAGRIGKWFREAVFNPDPENPSELYGALNPVMTDESAFSVHLGELRPESADDSVTEDLSDEEYAKLMEDSIRQQDAEEASEKTEE